MGNLRLDKEHVSDLFFSCAFPLLQILTLQEKTSADLSTH